jgi:hypothetical protein
MIYDERIATVSREEFEELRAILQAPPNAARQLTSEDRWRRDYQRDQERRRIVGLQGDLFAAKPITYYHRHHPAPSWDHTPPETIEAKLERITGDPLATFGPARADRPASLTTDEKAAIIAAAANWLHVGQRVRLTDAPGTVDPAFGIQRFLGRYGVIWRLCRTFTDHCYVFFDPVGGERTAKIEFAELRDLTPVID